MLDAALFHGIAVVIDDQILDEKSGIWTITNQIKDQGCHVISMTDIPDEAQLSNLRSVSFFVVDWNLTSTDIGDNLGVGTSLIPKALRKQNVARVVGFLQNLKKVRFAPVFIFTDQSVETVLSQLKKHKDLYEGDGPAYIFVKSKAEVIITGVFNVLSDSLRNAPSAYVLKKWEREYERAKNALFLDFYNKSVYWPLLLWKTFEDDHVPPSIELGNLIGRNLLSRMTPFEFDLAPFQAALAPLVDDKDSYRELLLKVLEGERFISKDQLHASSVAPGDVFKQKDHYFINIRPDCDCIAREGNEQDDVELYLLEGSKLTQPQVGRLYEPAYGLVRESDSQCIVFAMRAGITISFGFKTLKIAKWGEWKDDRIGRLLPPFLTRLQQRYSDYLQRPGLTRIPQEALDLPTKEDGPADSSAGQNTIGPTKAGGESVAVDPTLERPTVTVTRDSAVNTTAQPDLQADALDFQAGTMTESAPESTKDLVAETQQEPLGSEESDAGETPEGSQPIKS